MKPALILGAIALLLVAQPASALRCGNRLVSEGDPISKVRKFCGEPEAVQVRTIYRSGYPRSISRHSISSSTTRFSDEELLLHRRSTVEVIVEEWTYNFGPRKFMRMIRFENGLVAGIEKLGYGYHD